MAKMKMEIPNFNAIVKQLTDLNADVRKATEAALTETHKIVTQKAEQAMVPGNMPAGGKYWSGRTRESLVTTPTVVWDGDKASINVGFDISNGGLPSIFLMYGTPRTKPVKSLYDAVYGSGTKNEIIEAQTRIMHEAIYDAMKGTAE